MIRATARRTALYRFYDARERLLYVGITTKPGRRWQQHMEQKDWYPQVQHQAVTWYGSERAARRAETRAIRTEHPKFNVAGAVRPAGLRFDILDQPLGSFAVLLLCVPGAYFGVARLCPAVEPLAVLSILVVPVLVLAIAVIRGTQLVHRIAWHLGRDSGKAPASARHLAEGQLDAEARILKLIAEGHSPSKAGVLAGRSDSYGRQVARKAKELAAAAPEGQDAPQ